MPTTYDITAVRGDTWDGARFTLVVNGSPLNLAGAVFEWWIKDAKGRKAFSVGLGQGVTVNDEGGGVFTLGPKVLELPSGIYTFGVTLTMGARVKTYVTGRLKVNERAVR